MALEKLAERLTKLVIGRIANTARSLQIFRASKPTWGRTKTREELNAHLRKAFSEGWPISIQDALKYDTELRAGLEYVRKNGGTQYHLSPYCPWKGLGQDLLGFDARARTVVLSGTIYDLPYLRTLEVRVFRDRREHNPYDSEAVFKLATFLRNNDYRVKIEEQDLRHTKFEGCKDLSTISRVELVAELCRWVLKINPHHLGALECLAGCLDQSESAVIKELKERADIVRHAPPAEAKPGRFAAFLKYVENKAIQVQTVQEKALHKPNDSCEAKNRWVNA